MEGEGSDDSSARSTCEKASNDASRDSAAADLVLIGAPRLCRLGFDVSIDRAVGAEHRLYLRLAAEDPRTAHSRYNALIRRLVSFERAAECAG